MIVRQCALESNETLEQQNGEVAVWDLNIPFFFPFQGQLSILQDKIDHLERLLAENNEIISNIRDSVINLSESVKDGKGNPELLNLSKGSFPELLASPPVVIPVEAEDCQFASKPYLKPPDGVQMLDVYSLLPFDNPDGGVWKQGFDISYDEHEWDNEPLQVFVVPHSHNDPGWVKTFDEYYRDQTQHILNNMVVKLHEDEKRKILWSEISYFSKWWDSIDSQKRDAVKRLIERGQLEIATGGWVMTDEASAHYFGMIDQLLEGHQWLEKNLGVKPVTGWAVDPFGHSSTMAYILKRSGFSNMLIQRVHYSVKKHFSIHKTLEFFWRQNWDEGSSTDILCHMMPFYSYDVPHTCGPDPKICCQFDFKRLPGGRISCPWRVPPEAIHDGNVQHRAQMLLDQYRKKSKLFRTKVVLAPLGDDFRYTEASEWDQQFQNYQKLFDYMNSHPELHVKAQFGTISDYFKALRKAAGLSPLNGIPTVLPVVSGDFFTYADRDDHYWSGYFTSRPFYKRLDRVMESHLRAAEIIYSFALASVKKFSKMEVFPSSENYKMLTEARRNLGLFQHHDAITGTGKDWVVVDYGTRLFHSIMNLKRVIIDSVHFLILSSKGEYKHNPSSMFLQMDDVQPSQDALPRKTVLRVTGQTRSLVVYNPTEQERTAVVTVYVDSPKVKVATLLGQPVMGQISAVWEETATISAEAYQVSFVTQLPALGLKVYQLAQGTDVNVLLADYNLYKMGEAIPVNSNSAFKVNVMQSNPMNYIIENSHLKIWCSGSSGLMEKIRLKETGKELNVKVEFVWYGTTSNRDKSGAYLFLPDGEAKPYSSSGSPIITVTTGAVFSEVTSTYHHFTHTVRVYNIQGVEGQSVEMCNTVDIRGEFNREIAMRITSDVNSNDRFFTDLNGFQIQPRRTLGTLPLQANFYPLTTMAYIQDEQVRLTLHSAQSLGVASLRSGQLEVIMDRRLMQDDNRGLGQGVQDNKVTANLFRLLLEERVRLDKTENSKPTSFPSLLSHMSSLYLNHPVIPMAVSHDFSTSHLLPAFSPLTSSMPCDVHVVNLRTIQSNQGIGPSKEAAFILHRKGFDCGFSTKNMGLLCSTTKGKIAIERLFNELKVQRFVPASLSLMYTASEGMNSSSIQLEPMEISTFRIQLT
ncbi:alpha-mannosidase 2 [Polypterus senegalus]|uniref:alpha-mannosidase 2 n=1 Tax=Polypterus senegalus TaxID=55291 RepID=UPI001963EADB|nr:alpha-mannosidase 2 [Polypterus senegalus]